MIDRMGTTGELSETHASGVATPVQPSTPAQRLRYRRMIDEATNMVLDGGDDALQMKEVALRSGVALATLYRYFPSRQHLLLAIGISRTRDAQTELRKQQPLNGTTRERIAEYLLRHFRKELRHPGFRSLMNHTTHDAGPEYRALVDEYSTLFLQNLTLAAGPFTPEQAKLLPITISAANMAASQCIVGTLSISDVRFHILAASRLLDLPPEAIARDLGDAATDTFSPTQQEHVRFSS